MQVYGVPHLGPWLIFHSRLCDRRPWCLFSMRLALLLPLLGHGAHGT